MSFTVLEAELDAFTDEWVHFLEDDLMGITVAPEGEDEPVHITASKFFNLKFTTDTNDSRFGLGGPHIDAEGKDVVLGLADDIEWSGSLQDVLRAFVGTDELGESGGIVTKVLVKLAEAAGGGLNNVPVTLVNELTTRNGMWFIPGQSSVVSTALVFSIDPNAGALGGVKQALGEELGIKIGNLSPFRLHLQRTTYGTPSLVENNPNPAWEVMHAYSLAIQIPIGNFDFWLKLDSGSASVVLTQSKTADSSSWTQQVEDLGTGENAPPSGDESSPKGPDILNRIDLQSVTLGKNLGGVFFWNIKTVFEWRLVPPTGGRGPVRVLIGLSYDSLEGSFIGELLTRSSYSSNRSLPTYRASGDVLTVDVDELPEEVLLTDVFEGLDGDSIPSVVPNAISLARVGYIDKAGQSTMSLAATLVRSTPAPGAADENSVPAPFTWDSLSAYAQRTTTAAPPGGVKSSAFSFGAAATFTLRGRKSDNLRPASLMLGVEYIDGEWSVAGHVSHLNFGVLARFLDPSPNVRNAVLDVLGKLEIARLDVLYTFASGTASSFLLSGTVRLGKLELRLFYEYVGANNAGQTAGAKARQPGDPTPLAAPTPGTPAVWQLRADLGAASGKPETLGGIVDSIAGSENGSDFMPDFVKSIEIAPAAGDNSALSLEVSKTSNGEAVFALHANVLGIRFSYLQISEKRKTTRLLRVSVDKLPLISSIPLIDQLGQPFDEMLYLYVSGEKGLLATQVDTINASIAPSQKLMFKRAVTKKSPTAPVIQTGHHFMIINNGDVVLDHVFGLAQSKAQVATPRTARVTGTRAMAELPPANVPSKGSLSKKLGPLDISGLTVQYKENVLWIHMDAVLTLGPISLGLLGFGIGFLTTGIQLTNLAGIANDVFGGENRLRAELHGMSIGFERPPILLAGMFEHRVTPIEGGGSISSYQGGVGIGFPPYTFIGVGEYSVVTRSNGTSYKSVFVFAKLDGPLVTLEFATISGVRMGLGFNSVVRSPSIDELTEFPFIKNTDAPGASNNPMAILKAMTPTWVTPKNSSYWLAAGMTISSFDILAITAVAMFAFRDSGVIISIFADAVAQLPPHAPNSKSLILYVEIGMVAEMNFIDGFFRVEASLAPSSFLLVPQCRLSGGFALAYWFGNNPNAGDWVFSVGGYHRSFKPPAYYPVPKRLAISFVIGDNIQMIGQSYFAITPKAAMGGAMIHVSLRVGPVSAYLDCAFDCLINFHPFHYIVQFAVSVGVECRIDIWFIHATISIHIGADLYIEGPEFGGIAHVDFWFFGFDIEFGARHGRPKALDLIEFWKTTHQPGPDTSDRGDNDDNPVLSRLLYDANFHQDTSTPVKLIVDDAAFKFVLEDGNYPMPSKAADGPASESVPSTGAGAAWHVRGGSFRFGITTEFALSTATITDSASLGPENVYSSPMHVNQPITSALTVTVRRVLPDSTRSDPIAGWRDVSFTHKPVPTAMWAPYDSKLDIMARGPRAPPPAELLDGRSGATRQQALGVSMTAPDPTLSVSKIPKFKASAMAKLKVKDADGEDWYIPELEDRQEKFLAAELTGEEKEMDPPSLWDHVTDEWNQAGDVGEDVLGDPDDGVLGMAATMLGWDKDRPVGEVVGDRAPWLLKGKAPKKLVNGLKDFYLALPRFAV